MFRRRAFRPAGEPGNIDVEVQRLTPVLGQGMANVYTMPVKGQSRYVGSYDAVLCSAELGEYQRAGYLVYS